MPFGKAGGDPLASKRAAARWIGNLPLGDVLMAQQTISRELQRFNEERPSRYTRGRLPIFMLLDEKANGLQDTLVRQYLRNPRMSRSLESQLWHAVYGLYWEVARGYHAFVLHLTQQGARRPHDPVLPQITLRAIHAMGQLLKWRAIRYLPASEKLWLRLHNLYLIAEEGDFHRVSQHTYPADASTSTCETAYLHLLMVDLANSGTLYPRQLDLIDRWLSGWHDQLRLDADFAADSHSFYVNLAADHGPRHVRKPDSDKPLRYWSTTALRKTLEDLLAALHAGNTIPSQLGLSSRARTRESIDLLHHLQHQWAPLASREQRRAAREESKRLVDVAHGLTAILTQFKSEESVPAPSYVGVLSYREIDDMEVYGFVTDRTRERISNLHLPAIVDSPDVERWVVHDESSCGYGAVVESNDKDWLRVGTLVSIKPHDAQTWSIGIVRRISRAHDNTSSVGVETLPESAALVLLYETMPSGHATNGQDSKNSGQPHACLWLAGNRGTPDSILIDPVYFMPAKIVEMRGLDTPRLFVLDTPLEHSEGWMRVAVSPHAG